MYEPPLLDFYDNAILNNGDPASYTVSDRRHQRGRAGVSGQPRERAARLRPAATEHQRRGSGLPDAVGVAEQRAGRARAQQRHGGLGRLRQLDRPQPAGADGHQPDPDGADARRRPADLLDRGQRGDARRSDLQPRQHVQVDRRVDLQRVHRDADQADDARVEAQATYTLARGVDNAPLTGTYVVGSGDDRVSDPSNLDRDKGVTPFNQTHTFSVSTVIAPQVSDSARRRGDLSTTTSSAIILQANSGLPFNIRSTVDLNQDGVNNDRPNGIERNAGRLGTGVLPRPALLAVHPAADGTARGAVLRGEEPVQHREHRRRQPRDCRPMRSATPRHRSLIDGADYPTAGKSGYDQRLMQLGFKFTF